MEEHGAVGRLHGEREREEERRQHDEQEHGERQVHRALEHERRTWDVPRSVDDHGQVGDVAELDGGAEHPAHWRDDGELEMRAAADEDELLEDVALERLGGDQHAIDLVEPRLRLPQVRGREVGTLGDDRQVDVREQLELAASRVRDRARADEQRSLGGRRPAPRPASRPAQRAGCGSRHRPDLEPPLERRCARRREVEIEEERRGTGRRPGAEPRQLVDGQVPQRALVTVVEPVELREDDPHRNEGGRPERRPHVRVDRHERAGDREPRQHVRHGQDPAQERVPPDTTRDDSRLWRRLHAFPQ